LIRMEFAKGAPLKFLSHLDLMRTFQRIFRRAALPLAYSQGFNPHPKIAFSPALPVGAASQCEYLDVELDAQMSGDEILTRMNRQLPEGLEIKKIKEVSQPADALNAIINRAEYTVYFQTKLSEAEVAQYLEELLKREEIIIEKRSKKGIKKKNIRPGIYKLNCQQETAGMCIDMVVQTGSDGNVRPEQILDFLRNECNLAITEARITRTGLYVYADGHYKTPLEVVA